MRIAVVRDSDLPVRGSDETVRTSNEGELAQAIAAAGHEVTGLEAADALVIALTAGGRGLADRSIPAIPHVAAIARTADPLARGFDELDRSSVESFADAYVLGGKISDAIAWVTTEDRAARSRGQPRLTVIGTNRGDFGMSRSLAAEPMIIGRSSSFAQHPQRPDRLPTPTGTIARLHARVRCIDGVIAVNDAGSTNGTLVIRQGEPAQLLCPQQASGRELGPATAWLIRDPTADWVEIRIGDQVQLPFWRFRVDGDPSWRPED